MQHWFNRASQTQAACYSTVSTLRQVPGHEVWSSWKASKSKISSLSTESFWPAPASTANHSVHLSSQRKRSMNNSSFFTQRQQTAEKQKWLRSKRISTESWGCLQYTIRLMWPAGVQYTAHVRKYNESSPLVAGLLPRLHTYWVHEVIFP